MMAARLTLHPVMFSMSLRGVWKLPSIHPSSAASKLQKHISAAVRFGSDAQRVESGTIQESTEDFRFVERLIPPSRVPDPPKHAGPAPSGWVPPADPPPSLPYMIRRSRMHNVPVYTDLTHGNRRITLLRKVEGDIWALERDVKQFLKELTGKELPTQVNEVTMTLKVKGHFDKELKDWLTSKGF